MITIKQFANDSPGFDIQFRPFFEDQVYNPFRDMFPTTRGFFRSLIEEYLTRLYSNNYNNNNIMWIT